ncbi:hypothetical protein BC829DRAFT_416505 [Chytridium lagenaria]|nr:hypothetical protein BC829DRAFT_416505 [Chytridium lagenaria]
MKPYSVLSLLAVIASVATPFVHVIRGGGAALDAEAVYTCFKSFASPASSKQQQIDALLALTEVYPYTNLAKSKVDIVADLNAIRSEASLSDFEFHSRISRSINKLQDGHFAYAARCYSVLQFFQPWVIAARYAPGSSKPTLFLRDLITAGSTISVDLETLFPTLAVSFSRNLVNTFTERIGRDPSLLVGYTIESIDGKDPIAAVQEYADEFIGTSHTAETRFNYALAQTQYSKGLLQVQDGPFFVSGRASADKATSRNYTLRNPQTSETVTVTAPWLGLLPLTSSIPISTANYRRAFCENQSNVILAQASSNPFVGNPNNALEYVAYLTGVKADAEKKAALIAAEKSVVKTSPPRAVLSDDYSAFYYLDSSKTGVFALPAFLPATEDGELTDRTIISWLRTFANGLSELERRGATNLIIDVTNNGGGIICAGQSLASYIFKDSAFVNYDVRLTDTVSYLIENAATYENMTFSNPFSLGERIIPYGQSSTSAARTLSYLSSNAKQYTRGDTTQSFSGRFEIDCNPFRRLFKSFPQIQGWNPANVAIVGNGLCGSTCAETVRSFRSQYNVKTYVYGGTSGATFQPTSFEGGSVLDFDAVLDAFANIPRTSRKQPPQQLPSSFPLPARGQVLFWESYSKGLEQDTPDEWIVQNADEFLEVEDATEIVKIWEDVAKKMPVTKVAVVTSVAPSKVTSSVAGSLPTGSTGPKSSALGRVVDGMPFVMGLVLAVLSIMG